MPSLPGFCKCGRPRKHHCSLCYPCWYAKYGTRAKKKQNEQYRTDAAFRERKRTTAKRNYEQGKASGILVRERTLRGWLGYVLSGIKSARTKQGVLFSITLRDLMGIWEKQSGRCALTGLEMLTRVRSPYSASVDRIDSKGIYEIGNVQLVCVAANYAKCGFPNAAMIEFFQAIRDQ
jgi:hypothetical protein